MSPTTHSLKKIRYGKKLNSLVMRDIARKRHLYFSLNRLSRNGNAALVAKAIVQLFFFLGGYILVMLADNFLLLLSGYLLMGLGGVLLGINFGHDAAHGCLTGHRKADQRICEWIFGLQGLNGYLWQLRHNQSHHPHPNVYGYDSDMEMTGLLYLGQAGKKKRYHRFQHMYAPFVYMCMSLFWIFFIDLRIFFRKEMGNLEHLKHSGWQLSSLILYKAAYLSVFLLVPLVFSGVETWQIAAAFLLMHFLLSLILTLVFFVSHHVTETSYAKTSEGALSLTWIEQQVRSTMDFNGESRIANFFFGGFNAHLAHHLYPGVCHIHYPALTVLIRRTLREHGLVYNATSLVPAVISHFRLLRKFAREED